MKSTIAVSSVDGVVLVSVDGEVNVEEVVHLIGAARLDLSESDSIPDNLSEYKKYIEDLEKDLRETLKMYESYKSIAARQKWQIEKLVADEGDNEKLAELVKDIAQERDKLRALVDQPEGGHAQCMSEIAQAGEEAQRWMQESGKNLGRLRAAEEQLRQLRQDLHKAHSGLSLGEGDAIQTISHPSDNSLVAVVPGPMRTRIGTVLREAQKIVDAESTESEEVWSLTDALNDMWQESAPRSEYWYVRRDALDDAPEDVREWLTSKERD